MVFIILTANAYLTESYKTSLLNYDLKWKINKILIHFNLVSFLMTNMYALHNAHGLQRDGPMLWLSSSYNYGYLLLNVFV